MPATRILVAVSLALLALLPGDGRARGARNDRWTVIGPGGGGSHYIPTISPHNPNVVMVACDMTGAYLTKDGGKNWRMINLRGVVRFFVFDPSDVNTIYASTGALWRSADAGNTWQLIHPAPKTVTAISMIDDHAGQRFETTSDEGRVQVLAVDPKDSRTLYAIFDAAGQTVLRKSADGGQTWARLADGIGTGARRLYVDPRSPRESRTIFVVGASGVARYAEGSLRALPPPAEPFVDVSAGFREADGGLVVYGVSENGAFCSIDGGATWKHTVPGRRLMAVATSLFHPEIAYLSYGNLQENGTRYFGVAKTADYGATWKPVWKESRAKSPQVDDGWLSERFGPGWGGQPENLGVSPTKPEICYATDSGRTLRSLDGGATWTAAYTRRVPNGGWTTTGLDVTTNYGIHFDPFDRNHVFIGYTDIGLFGSDDGGASWYSATVKGVPGGWVNTTYWLVFDPEVRGRLWAAMSGTHDLPRPKMWRDASPASYRGGVLRSEDGGKSWRALTIGTAQMAATHILLDRRGTRDARTLYVAGFGKGVFRSRDGGESWELKDSGLPSREPFVWRLEQDVNGVLYAVIARRSEDGSIGTERDGSLYRSRNSADSWEKVPLPEGVNGPNGLAIDPKDPNRLYLAAWRRRISGPEGGGGIYVSSDSGKSWRQVLSKDQHIYDVTIDPRDSSKLYACGFESSAWRSADRGESWQRIRGYNFRWGHRVIPDPRNTSMIYVTTYGGSVWHGPAAGDPDAAEDIPAGIAAYSQK